MKSKSYEKSLVYFWVANFLNFHLVKSDFQLVFICSLYRHLQYHFRMEEVRIVAYIHLLHMNNCNWRMTWSICAPHLFCRQVDVRWKIWSTTTHDWILDFYNPDTVPSRNLIQILLFWYSLMLAFKRSKDWGQNGNLISF